MILGNSRAHDRREEKPVLIIVGLRRTPWRRQVKTKRLHGADTAQSRPDTSFFAKVREEKKCEHHLAIVKCKSI